VRLRPISAVARTGRMGLRFAQSRPIVRGQSHARAGSRDRVSHPNRKGFERAPCDVRPSEQLQCLEIRCGDRFTTDYLAPPSGR
jgi:hypothetical protein